MMQLNSEVGELFHVRINQNDVETDVVIRASSPDGAVRSVKTIASYGPLLSDKDVKVMGLPIDEDDIKGEIGPDGKAY